MPTFFPPLGHSSQSLVDPTEPLPYLQLTFTAQATPDEHARGVYQLWTDLPALDEAGQPMVPVGEWHAIDFKPLPAPSATAGPSEPDTFCIPAFLPLDPDTQVTLQAALPIHPHQGQYAYTIRQEHHSGHIDWLGSGGDNGVVSVVKGEKGAEVSIDHGAWDGTTQDSNSTEWTGVAMEVKDVDGRKVPVLTRLPHPRPLSAHLMLGFRAKQPDAIPFSLPIPTPAATPIAPQIASIAVLCDSKNPLSIAANEVIPAPSTSGATFGRSEHSSLRETLSKALLNGQHTTSLQLLSMLDDQTFVLLRLGDRSQGAPSAQFLLAGHTLQENKTVKFVPPSGFDLASPILVQTENGRKLFRELKAEAAQAKGVEMVVGKGVTAAILRLTELAKIRVSAENAIWVGSPDAALVHIKEEPTSGEPDASYNGEVTENHIPDNASPIDLSESVTSDSNDTSFDTAAVDAEIGTDADTNADVEAEAEAEADDEDEEEDGTDADTIRPVVVHQGYSVLEVLKRLFYGFWSWLFRTGPPTLTQADHEDGQITPVRSREDGRAARASESSVDGDGSVTTPPTERTPLLATPGLSRSASSSGVFSPLASPESAITIKALPQQDHFASPTQNKGKSQRQDRKHRSESSTSSSTSDGEAIRVDALETAPVSKPAERPLSATIPAIQSRSYTVFDLDCPPPYKFFLAPLTPGSAVVDGMDVKWEIKARDEKEWYAAEVKDGAVEGGVVDVNIEVGIGAGGEERHVREGEGRWQVRVGRA